MEQRFNVTEAKARLSELIEAALAGQDIVIARRNTPVVRLVAVATARPRPRFGKLAGRVQVAADFERPLAEMADYR